MPTLQNFLNLVEGPLGFLIIDYIRGHEIDNIPQGTQQQPAPQKFLCKIRTAAVEISSGRGSRFILDKLNYAYSANNAHVTDVGKRT